MKDFFKNKKVIGIASAAVAALVIVPNVLQFGSLAAPSAAEMGKELPATLDAASSVNYSTILGRAIDYGVISMDFHQRSHMESPIATYNFYNDSGDQDEVDFIDSDHTAQFIIGNILAGKLDFGGRQSPGSFHLELGLPGDYNGVNHPGASMDDIVFDRMDSNSTPLENYYFTYKSQEYIYNNIGHIVQDAETQSAAISGKIDDGYAINLDDYEDKTSGYKLNLYYEEFQNRVVYVDVDDELMNRISESNGLTIEKYDSTIVVFNVGDNVTTNAYKNFDDFGKGGTSEQGLLFEQFRVVAHDDATGDIIGDGVLKQGEEVDSLTSESPSQAFKDAGKLAEAELDDQHINQKIIWNVTKDDVPVRFNATGGTFLLTGHNPADLSTSSAGWVVTNGEFYLTQEWHYEYNGGSQDAPRDGEFEFHFALHKTFADKLSADPDSDKIDSILTSAGDFHFALYQYTDSNYDQSTATLVDTDDTLATNKVMFDPMRFDPDDAVYDDGTETFYYRIYETNTEPVLADGYKILPNEDSYVEIKLTVNKVDDPNLGVQMEFVVDHTTHLIDSNGTEYLYHINNDIEMSGVEFDVGNFYNVAVETATIKVDKLISNTDTYLAGATFTLTSDKDLSNVQVKGAASNTIANDCITFTTADGRVTITGLDDGTYVLTETQSPDGYSNTGKTNSVTITVSGGQVTGNSPVLPTSSNTDTAYNNGIYKFNNDAEVGSIKVTKTANGNPDASGKDFQFYVEAYDNGTFAGYVQANGTLGTSKNLFTVEEGDADGTKVDNLDFAYTYRVVEYTDNTSLAVSYEGTYYQLEEPTYTGNDVTLNVTTPTGNVEIENTYTRVYQYSITISKTVVGATMSNSGTFPIVITYTEYDADAGRDITYYLQVQNGVITRQGNAYYTPDPQNCVTELSVNEPIVLQGEYIKEGVTYTIYELVDGNSDVYDRANEAYRFDPQATHELTKIEVNGSETNTIDVTLDSNKKTDTVSFTNYYDHSEEVPSITINKTNDNGDLIGGAVFTLTAEDSTQTAIDLSGCTITGAAAGSTASSFTTVDDQQIVISDIPDGNYILSEANAPSGYVPHADIQFTVENGVITTTLANIIDNTNNEITVLNEATPTASLTISKTISGAELNALETISFTGTGDQGTTLTIPDLTMDNVNDGIWTDAGNGTYTYTINNLTVGEKFDIAESAYGETIRYTLDANDSYTSEDDVEIVTGGAIVYLTNDYDEHFGSLKIEKNFTEGTGLTGFSGTETFSITVTFSEAVNYAVNGGAAITTASDTYTANLANGDSVTLSNIPAGVRYTVSETVTAAQTAAGYSNVSITGDTTVAIPAEDENTVTVNNKYEETTASLTISKTISGAELNDLETISFTGTGDQGTTLTIPDLTMDNVNDGIWTDAGNGTYTYTINNLTVGEKFDIAESAYGETIRYTLDANDSYTSEDDVEIVTGGAIVYLTNDYDEQFGSLKIDKNFTEGTGLAGYSDSEEFEIVVRFSEAVNYAVNGGAAITTASNTYTTTLANGDSVVLSNIPAGVTYTVEENLTNAQTAAGYSNVSVTGDTTAAIVADTENSVTVNNKYEVNTASLTISKTISGAELNDLETISFTGTGDQGTTLTIPDLTMDNVTDGIWTDAGNGTYTYTINNLTVGEKFDIAESAYGETTRYTLNATSNTSEDDVEIVTGGAIVYLTNDYDEHFGSLKIEKNFTEGTGLTGFSGTETFSITVTFSEAVNYAVNGGAAITTASDTYTANLANGDSVTLSNIPAGVRYTVSETVTAAQTAAGYSNVSITGDTAVAIPADDENTVTVNNKYEVNTASLTISKTISGAELNDLETISFTGTGDQGTTLTIPDLTMDNVNDGIWTDAGNGTYTYTINNLTVGEKFDIAESAYGETTRYTLNATSNTSEDDVEIVTGGAIVYLTNDYDEQFGSLKIDKNFTEGTGLAGYSDSEEFEIVVRFSEAVNYAVDGGTPITTASDTYTANLANGDSVVLSNIPAGVTYTVEENLTNAQTAAGYSNVSVTGDTTVAIVADTENSVAVNNKYEVNTASLTISKALVGAALNDLNGGVIEFTISPAINGVDTITLSRTSQTGWTESNGVYTYTFDDAVVGTEYTITESNDGTCAYYTCTATDAADPVTVTATGPNVAEFTNTYEEVEFGSLEIVKDFAVTSEAIPAGTTFTVDVAFDDTGDFSAVTCVGGTVNYAARTVSILFTENGGSFTIENLPDGIGYEVTEDVSGLNGNYAAPVYTNKTGAIDVSDPSTADITATVTNNLQPVLGSIMFTKKLSGDWDAAGADDQEFTFTISGPGFATPETFTITGEGEKQWDNLPLGEYTITEDLSSAKIANYTVTASGNGVATVELTDDSRKNVSIDNEYDEILGSLTIHKFIGDGSPADADNIEFSFNVTGPNGYDQTFSRTGEGDIVINDLPLGEYTVTEIIDDDIKIAAYELTVSNNGVATAELTEASVDKEVNFTNTYAPAGSLVVYKTLSGDWDAAGAGTKEFTFTIQGPSYPTATEFTLTGADSQTFTDLEPGEYVITETGDARIDGYTLTADGAQNVTIDSTTAVQATINNDYQEILGSLTITKIVDGDAPKTTTDAMVYNFEITGPNNYSETYSIRGEDSITIYDLSIGEYTVTEVTDGSKISGYKLTASYSSTTATITVSDLNPSIDVTNTYDRILRDVEIDKTDMQGADLAGATLQITNAAGYNIDLSGVTVTQNGSPAKDVSITSSSVTFTTVAGFSAIIHDMPVGRYVLTELAAPEGYLVAESITFYIDDEGDLYVAGTPDELVGEVWMKDKTDPNVTTTTTTEESEGTTTTETTPPTESTTTTSDSSETTETTKPTDTDDANKKKTDETTETTAAGDTAVASTGEKALSTTLLLAIVMLSASAFVYLIRFGYIKEEEKDEK